MGKLRKGQSILEILIAVSIFTVIIGSLVVTSLSSESGLLGGTRRIRAQALSREGLEAVRSIRDGAYNELIFNQSAISSSSGSWKLIGEGTREIIGEFTRTITFEPVCRDISNKIVVCPGSYQDVHSKFVTSNVSWEIRPEVFDGMVSRGYITNWDSKEWTQTDWSGGDGQNIWLETDMYDVDDNKIDLLTQGELKLATTTDDATFESSGELVSSSFDMGIFSTPQMVEWVETIPVCVPICEIKIQIQTASDDGGVPGVWSSWSGPEGEDGDETDYFTIGKGELININHNGSWWLRYKVFLSGDTRHTPILNVIKLNYK